MDDDLDEMEQAHLREQSEPLIPAGPERFASAEEAMDREPEPREEPDALDLPRQAEPAEDDQEYTPVTRRERDEFPQDSFDLPETETLAAPPIAVPETEEDEDIDEDDYDDYDDDDDMADDVTFELPRSNAMQVSESRMTSRDREPQQQSRMMERSVIEREIVQPVINVTVQSGPDMADQIARQVEPGLRDLQDSLSRHVEDSLAVAQYTAGLETWA